MGVTINKIPKVTVPFDELFGDFDPKQCKANVPDASSGDGILRTTKQMKEWADKLGCDVREAKDNELFVDLDTERQFEVFKFQIKLLKKHFYFKIADITPSKQGLPHRHVVIELAHPLPLLARIALQACLGSDPTRELLSVKRAIDVKEGVEEQIVVFFEKRNGEPIEQPKPTLFSDDELDAIFNDRTPF